MATFFFLTTTDWMFPMWGLTSVLLQNLKLMICFDGNNSDLQSNNQVAFIPQFSCMQPFHLPSTDEVLTWPWLLPYAKFGSESCKQRWLICFLHVKFPHVLSWSSSYGLLMITTDVSSIVINGLLLTGSSKIPIWPSKKWDAHHDTVFSP